MKSPPSSLSCLAKSRSRMGCISGGSPARFQMFDVLLGVMENGPALNAINPRTGIAVHYGFIGVTGDQGRAGRESREHLIIRDDLVPVVDVQEICPIGQLGSDDGGLRNLFALPRRHDAVVALDGARFLIPDS